MDREEIQRRDFPTGRRGYEPSAVDEHLRRVADAFEARTALPPPTLSGATADQVRAILEAAERSVSELHSRANEEASGHVARVQTAADGMLAKLDALESELGNLLSALRESGERLTRGLADLQAEVARGDAPGTGPWLPVEEDFAAAGPGSAAPDDAAAGDGSAPGGDAAAGDGSAPGGDDAARDDSAFGGDIAARDGSAADGDLAAGDDAAVDGDLAAGDDAAVDGDVAAGDDAVVRGDDAARDDPAIAPGDLAALRGAAAEDSAAGELAPLDGPDEAGARLIALNMALGGSSREETARYLAEHFALADPDALLDDVYARAGR